MKTDTLDQREEDQLLATIKKAVSLVDGGMSPNEAIEKVAREHQLTPGKVRVVCAAYNTGRQTSQREAHANILDKLADFPLADADAVVASLYEPKTKQAAAHPDYAMPPSWFVRQTPMTKAAAAPISLVEKTAEPYQRDPQHAMNKAYGDVRRAKVAAEETSRKKTAAEDGLRRNVANLVTYFRKFANERLPFATVEQASSVYFGTEGPAIKPLLDLTYQRARLKEARAKPDPTIQKVALDLHREPFTIIRACLNSAHEVNSLTTALKTAQEKIASVREESFRPFSEAGVSKKPAQDSVSHFFETEKAATGVMGMPAFGAMVGTMLSRGIGSPVKEKDELIDDAWMDLEDPQHQNEIRKIKTHAMLNSMMTDPDDPISGYDPDKVLSMFNELSQLAPRVASQPAAIKPIMRKHLAGNTEPFEAKEVADVEKGLAATRLSTPNTSILNDASRGILG